MENQTRNAVIELHTINCSAGEPAYLLLPDERVEAVFIAEQDVNYKLSQVEGFVKITEGKTVKTNASIDLGTLKTVCLVIETDKPTEIQVKTIK